MFRAVLGLIFLACSLAGLQAAAAAIEPLTADGGRIALVPCVAVAQAGDTPDRVLAAPRRFVCNGKQAALPGHQFWVRLMVPPAALADHAAVLSWPSLWQDRAQFHFLYADGRRTTATLQSADAARHLGLGAMFRLPVPDADAALTGILVRIEGAANVRGVMMAPELLSRSEATRSELGLAALYSGFAGLCLALLTYNLLIWTVLRQRFLLAYCAMLVSALLYSLTSSAAINLLLWPLDNNFRLRLNYIFLAGTAIAALVFARSFFECRVFNRPLRIGFAAAIAGLVLTACCFALFAPVAIKPLDYAYFAAFAAGFTVAIWILIRAWIERSAFLGLYTLAWSTPLVFGVVRVLYGIHLLPYSFWIDNSTLLAMGFEAMVSSLIIALRIRAMRTDRDRALSDEREARRLADTDPLTGLLNRRALVRFASGEEGGSGLFRLVLIDIDQFKKINDTAGHDTGDDVLRILADLITSALRPGAMAARLGGEEFAILFPAVDSERRYYAGLLDTIRAARMPKGLRVTVSMGVADGELGAEEAWRALYRRADAALYRAKADGRDRICTATYFPEGRQQAA